MGDETKIQWCDHTFNPWRGCTKVSPGCAHCYAETQSKRNPKVLGEWGPQGRRAIASEAYWAKPFQWNRAAADAGERRRVFCASLADVFETNDQVDEARARLFRVIDSTPHLDWLLLTKRPERIGEKWHTRSFLDKQGRTWGDSRTTRARFLRRNVWLGTSVEDQQRADERVPHLLRCGDLAPVLFLSVEPLLEPIDLTRFLPRWQFGKAGNKVLIGASVEWVIIGGESGPQARRCDPEWIWSLIEQCREAGVACFVKQLGANVEACGIEDPKGGDPGEWPENLRVRAFPQKTSRET